MMEAEIENIALNIAGGHCSRKGEGGVIIQE